jgi:hypothetical protein
MGDREYLYELALILDSAEGTIEGETHFIRIELMTAKDIAAALRKIAGRMPNMLH